MDTLTMQLIKQSQDTQGSNYGLIREIVRAVLERTRGVCVEVRHSGRDSVPWRAACDEIHDRIKAMEEDA